MEGCASSNALEERYLTRLRRLRAFLIVNEMIDLRHIRNILFPWDVLVICSSAMLSGRPTKHCSAVSVSFKAAEFQGTPFSE